MANQCTATTAGGARCKRPAGESGLCSAHAPTKPNPQRDRYRKFVGILTETCKTLGWDAFLESEDKRWRFGIIHVSKRFGFHEVEGTVTFSVHDNRFQCRIAKTTSFHGTGLVELQEAIEIALKESGCVDHKADKIAAPPASIDPHVLVRRLLRKFQTASKPLRNRQRGRQEFCIVDEYDVQDLTEALLRAYFDDVRPEESAPSVAGKASRMDFLLKAEQIVIETKCVSQKNKNAIRDELIIDIEHYRAHPDCGTLYCLVYDRDRLIKNPPGFEKDLSGDKDGLKVTVIVCPH